MNSILEQYKHKKGILMACWVVGSLAITGYTYFIIFNVNMTIIESIILVVCFFIIDRFVFDNTSQKESTK